VHAFNTPVILFIVIVLSYLVLSLLMGGQKIYFEPLTTQPEDPEGAPKPAPEAIASGAEPWKVGEKGGTAGGAKPTAPTPAKEDEAKS
jgi:hypothetical protein